MTKHLYQIKITLKEIEPKIWRRLLVPSNLSLADLHMVIQTAIGWTNSHLHQFIKNDTFYRIKYLDDDLWYEMNNVDYKGMKISDLLNKEQEEIVYEYDFGDGWEHDVLLERILPFDEKSIHPVCLEGERHCPPEDCGGVWGYSEMLEVLEQPDHEEYESYIQWLGGEFDPEHFNKKQVNEMLGTKNYGGIEL